jgi:hypothetical protein
MVRPHLIYKSDTSRRPAARILVHQGTASIGSPSGREGSAAVTRPRRSVSGVRNVIAASLPTWDAPDGTGPWVAHSGPRLGARVKALGAVATPGARPGQVDAEPGEAKRVAVLS